jgi:hypothetical protein
MMGVFMLHCLVQVFVFVALGEIEPQPHAHHQSGRSELRRYISHRI